MHRNCNFALLLTTLYCKSRYLFTEFYEPAINILVAEMKIQIVICIDLGFKIGTLKCIVNILRNFLKTQRPFLQLQYTFSDFL